MSPKKSERSELEYLRGLVRELKSQVKHLKKEMGRAQKREKRLENVVSEQEEEAVEVTEHDFKLPGPTCPDCGGKLDIIEMGPTDLHKCLDEKRCGFSKFFKRSAR